MKTLVAGALAGAALALALVWALRPVPRPVIVPPARIVHDTVTRLDTVVLRREVTRAVAPDTVWLTHETVTPPETVTVVPALIGLIGLKTGDTPGDSGLAYGFKVRPLAAGHYGLNEWRATWVAPGPLASLALDSDGIKVGFWPAPPAPCRLECRLKQGAAAAAIVEGVRILLGRP